jgi:hypothetical protein
MRLARGKLTQQAGLAQTASPIKNNQAAGILGKLSLQLGEFRLPVDKFIHI